MRRRFRVEMQYDPRGHWRVWATYSTRERAQERLETLRGIYRRSAWRMVEREEQP